MTETRMAIAPSMAALERLAAMAASAGAAAMAFYGNSQALKIELKADDSPVTAADRASHDALVRELTCWDPETPIVSEEGTLPPFEERSRWDRFWLVDPLDGTKEFLSANGEFTVNVALIDRGEPVLGVVAAPAVGSIYVAGRGCGAWRCTGGGSLEAIGIAAGAARREGPVRIVESRSHPSPELEAFLATLGPVERIKLGSSLKFCKVAEGEADLYPRFGRTMEWDVAAGDCIFRNSGPRDRQRPSPLVYNQPTLSTPGFIIGELPADVGARITNQAHNEPRRTTNYGLRTTS